MYTATTQATMRDQIRRNMGIIPPVDAGSTSGAAPTGQPWPGNPMINSAISEAVSWVNRKAGIGQAPQPIPVNVPAQTDSGPQRIGMAEIGPGGDIRSVRRAWFDPGTGVSRRLTMRYFTDVDWRRREWQLTSPGTPIEMWIEGNTIWLHPASTSAGTLYILATQALVGPEHDDDGVENLHSDDYPTIIAKATALICRARPNDPVRVSQYQIYTAEANDGLGDILVYLSELAYEAEPGLRYVSTRRRSGR